MRCSGWKTSWRDMPCQGKGNHTRQTRMDHTANKYGCAEHTKALASLHTRSNMEPVPTNTLKSFVRILQKPSFNRQCSTKVETVVRSLIRTDTEKTAASLAVSADSHHSSQQIHRQRARIYREVRLQVLGLGVCLGHDRLTGSRVRNKRQLLQAR